MNTYNLIVSKPLSKDSNVSRLDDEIGPKLRDFAPFAA